MYFKTSEQQLFGRNLGCYLHYFQYQIRCYGCIFKFLNTKIREAPLCYINLVYQIWKFYGEKSLNNQKVHPQLLKSNATNSILKLPQKKFLSCTASRKMGLSLFAKKLFKSPPKVDLCVPRINMELNIWWSKRT